LAFREQYGVGSHSACKLQKGRTRLAAASDKVYQLIAHGRWFSPTSSTTKTDRHDIAEILLKVMLNTKINQFHSEEFEDTKGAIRIHKSKKNRQHNGQKKKYKRTNNDLQNIHKKLKIE
jgi:hypothetical protein